MGLILNNKQSNDAKLLYLTDNSTWGSDSIPALGSVTSATLQISKKEPTDDDFVVYNAIDVFEVFTSASGDPTLLVFPLAFNNGISLTTDEIGILQFPDGIWKVQYIINESVNFASPLELMLDQIIKFKIYKDLSQIPLKYLASSNYYTKPMDDVLLEKCMHYSMEANAYIAKQDAILETLDTLQRLTQ